MSGDVAAWYRPVQPTAEPGGPHQDPTCTLVVSHAYFDYHAGKQNDKFPPFGNLFKRGGQSRLPSPIFTKRLSRVQREGPTAVHDNSCVTYDQKVLRHTCFDNHPGEWSDKFPPLRKGGLGGIFPSGDPEIAQTIRWRARSFSCGCIQSPRVKSLPNPTPLFKSFQKWRQSRLPSPIFTKPLNRVHRKGPTAVHIILRVTYD